MFVFSLRKRNINITYNIYNCIKHFFNSLSAFLLYHHNKWIQIYPNNDTNSFKTQS